MKNSRRAWHTAFVATLGLLAFSGVSTFGAGCGSSIVKRPDGGEGLLGVGAQAPDFSLRDAKGTTLKLSELRGSQVVVYFYPKDDTPGCTKEACAFRDSFSKYDAAGVKVVGVSQDTEESHAQFRTKFKLPFPLAADADGAISKSFGVKSHLGMSSRVTFLLDKNGKVAHVWPDVSPAGHAEDVLAHAQSQSAAVAPTASATAHP
ncbi:MAG: peroxiredoxin [Polyangiaceae bacterium]